MNNNTGNLMERWSFVSSLSVGLWGAVTQNVVGFAGLAVAIFTALYGWHFKRKDDERRAEERAERRHLSELRAQEIQASIDYLRRTGKRPPARVDSDLAPLLDPANDEDREHRA